MNTYGRTRSNRSTGEGIAAPSGDTETGEGADKPQPTRLDGNTYGQTRSNRSSNIAAPADPSGTSKTLASSIIANKASQNASPIGCVTEAGAKDANCDGVDDAAPAKIDRSKRVRPSP